VTHSLVTTRTFYRIDSTRVSLREYWWGSHSPAILIAALLKLLRVRIPSATDDPNVESLSAFEVEPSAVPEDVRARFAPQLRHLEHLGFASPVWHAIDDDLHHVQTHLATMAHRTGYAWARVHNRLWHLHTPPRNVSFVEFVTEHTDGTFVWSLSSKPDLAAPSTCTVVRRRDATPTTLWTMHRAALPRTATVPVGSLEDLRGSFERHHAAVRDFHLRRGVFRPASEVERCAARTHEADRQAASAAGSRCPEIVAEVRRLQRGQSSVTSAILILLASVALFVGMGGRSLAGGDGAPWQALLVLMPILFFHEAGHFLAMRLFGYRNLKMFFIPFIGAAVSGRHYNVPGWKKAVVSLMGPLPGIVAGVVLGVIGLSIQQPLLVKAALMTLLLNGFNLLPVLPLDGGWVLEAILFSRHMVLELVFRVVAILGLVGLGLWSGDRILGMLGLVMMVSLPTAYKLARITRDLRRSELQPISPDHQSIPAATAEAIIARIKEAFPAKLPTKVAAQHTLQVFETLNARPPGALASLGIGLVHGTGLIVAIVFAGLFLLGLRTNLGTLMLSAATLPERPLDPAAIEIHLGAGPEAPRGPHETVVASFATATEARQAFVTAQSGPSHTARRLFGQSLLVALPPGDATARERWLGSLEGLASTVFVATPETSARIQLSCLAPSADVASRIEEDLGNYFLAAAMHIVPPWLEGDARTPAERARHARARRTYAQLARAPAVAYQDPRLMEYLEKMGEARDTREAERLRSEHLALGAELRAKEIDRIRQVPETDGDVVARYQALFAGGPDSVDPGRMTAELGPLLGQLELTDGKPKPAAGAFAATGGISRQGLLLAMPFLRFEDPFQGPPALVKWLRDRGCSDFRYALTPGFVPGQDGEEDGLPVDHDRRSDQGQPIQ
jgi:Zn-dependent protease